MRAVKPEIERQITAGFLLAESDNGRATSLLANWVRVDSLSYLWPPVEEEELTGLRIEPRCISVGDLQSGLGAETPAVGGIGELRAGGPAPRAAKSGRTPCASATEFSTSAIQH